MNPLSSSAFVATDTPARYISRLCKHFAHKIPVSFDEQQGRIEFDSGQATLQAEEQGLRLQVESGNADDLQRLQAVVASHFERFAWQEALTLDWQPQSASS
ncbi:DUF2218 domain-containing protein [Ectopseudomonas khazarica]|uniref:DUF2218 domain-containing protein n=1 Tax=Ectopseudomonas khazarica TaxID=2502979 RepID=UPI00064574BD